jgi:hypothetical protein
MALCGLAYSNFAWKIIGYVQFSLLPLTLPIAVILLV